MAEQIVSPGVFQRETDQSFITPAPVEVGAAIIGPTVKGPVERPTVVTSFADYKNKFGTTFISASNNLEFFTSIAAQKFFANGGNSMLVTRVASGSHTSADSSNISTEIVSGVNKASGSLTLTSFAESTTIFVSSSTIGLTQFIGQSNPSTDASDDTTRFFDRGSNLTDFINNFVDEFNATNKFNGFTARNEGNTKIGITGSIAGTGGNNLGFSSGSGTNPGEAPSGLGSLTEGGTDSSAGETVFTLSTIGQGTVFNATTGPTDGGEQFADSSLKSGSADNLRWEISGVNKTAGTFNVSIRRGDDNLNNKIILETFVGCSLDPKSDNFISRVIGDQTTTTTEEEGQTFIKVEGDFPNQSKFVRVKSVSKLTTDYLLADGSVGTDAGVSYQLSLPQSGSGSFQGATGTNIPVAEPLLTFKNISSVDTQGLDATEYTTAINILKNQDEYRFSTITAPGIYNEDYATTVASLIELCEGRGDCFYIADMVPYGSSVTTTVNEAGKLNTNFAGTYWPWVQVPSTELSKNVYVPASTVMQGVYAANDRVAAPWFAPAGLNRGGLPVVRSEFKLNQKVRDKLYDNKVNPIATFPRVGPVAYGQKTLQKKASALDRINVRRLLISLKNFIGDTSKNLVFEQNTTVTRNRFLNAVTPFLESVQQRQGLFAFRVVMDESNNTAEAIDRNQLVGQIFIQPTKTAEFIILDYTIQPTGATFND